MGRILGHIARWTVAIVISLIALGFLFGIGLGLWRAAEAGAGRLFPTATPTSTATATSTPQPSATATSTTAATATATTAPSTATATSVPAATASPTTAPANTATPVPPANTPSTTGGGSTGTGAPAACSFSAPGDLDSMVKTKIELAPQNTWFHRVFNERLFNAANSWGGADSWFVTLALGSNSGGNWTSHGNPGQIVFRGTSTNINWCLGVLTTAKWKEQFMGTGNMPAAINVRISPNTNVTVVNASGVTKTQPTSDQGDITITLPDSGVVIISVSYQTASPTHESLVWWGPQDRTTGINILDAR